MVIERKRNISHKPAPTLDQFNNFQGIYDYFNKELFDNKLPNCILNFSRNIPNVVATFYPERWIKNGTIVHEISLNPDTLFNSIQEDMQSIVHEMVHLWQHEKSQKIRSYHDKEWADKMKSIGLMPSSTGKPGGDETGQKMDDYAIPGGLFLKAFSKMPKNIFFPYNSIARLARIIQASPAGVGIKEIASVFNIKSEEYYDDSDAEIKEARETDDTDTDEIESIILAAKERKHVYDRTKKKYSCECANVWGKPNLNIRCLECDTQMIEQ